MTGAVETVEICKDWISSHDYFYIERNLSYAEYERSSFKNEHVRFLLKQNPRYIENNVCTVVTNCFIAHERVILVFISRVAKQRGK